MGNQHGHNNLSGANLQNYGLSQSEQQTLQAYFANYAGRDGKLELNEFIALYQQLSPNVNPATIRQIAQNTFLAADVNHDGKVDLNEFFSAYILSRGGNLQQNLNNLLGASYGQNGNLTPQQAYQYQQQLYNFYGQPTGYNPSQFTNQFANRSQIPYTEFVNYVAPHFQQYSKFY